MDTPYLFNKAVMLNGNGTDLKDFEMHFIKIMNFLKGDPNYNSIDMCRNVMLSIYVFFS